VEEIAGVDIDLVLSIVGEEIFWIYFTTTA
jgi:hypothetical protein